MQPFVFLLSDCQFAGGSVEGNHRFSRSVAAVFTGGSQQCVHVLQRNLGSQFKLERKSAARIVEALDAFAHVIVQPGRRGEGKQLAVVVQIDGDLSSARCCK